MSQYRMAMTEKRIQRTVRALNENRFEAHYLRSHQELFTKLQEYMKSGTSCSVGGSQTLLETGVVDFLQREPYEFFNRYAPDADLSDIYAKGFTCDTYLASANAITEDGKLYNVDGRGNRVAAMIYGPKQVIVVAGSNKIVRSVEEARKRNQEIAAPTNAARLNKKTPCATTGICSDCYSPERICCFEVVFDRQLMPGRIKVLLLPDAYGY